LEKTSKSSIRVVVAGSAFDAFAGLGCATPATPHEIAQVVRHVAAALVALVGRFCERAVEDGVERHRELRVDRRHRRMRLAGDAVHHRKYRVVSRALERRAAHQQLVEHHAERKDIGAGVHRQPGDRLGRHVLGRAEGRTGLRHRGRRHVRDAKIRDLRAPVRRYHDVGGFDVAVRDFEALREVEPVGDLRHQIGDGGNRQPRCFAQNLLQRTAFEQFHRDISNAILLAYVVDRNDVGVVEAACGTGLAQEAFAHLAHDFGRQARQQGFYRYVPLDERIDGAVHGAHGAAAEFRNDDVTAKLLLIQALNPRR
jgi:hypothetical protein